MGKKPRLKSGPSRSTSLILSQPPPKPRDEPPSALPKDAEEEALEKLIFGDAEGFEDGLNEGGEGEVSDEEGGDEILLGAVGGEEMREDLMALKDDQLFFVDEGPASASTAVVVAGESKEREEEEGEEEEEEQPVWVDSDDEMLTISLSSRTLLRKLRDNEGEDLVSGTEYTRRLRRQFERIYPVPAWALTDPERKRARLDDSSDEDKDGEEEEVIRAAPSLSQILQSSTNWTRRAPGKLRPEKLTIVRLSDANKVGGSLGMISTLQFHPHHPLLLSSGPDATLRLHHIDGTANPPATNLHIRRTPVATARFHPTGQSVVAAGRRRYFHIWDLATGTIEKVTRVYGHADVQRSMESFALSPDGKYMALVGSKGFVNVLHGTTYQWLCSLKVEGRVADLSWWSDGLGITVANKGGEVWEYDITTERVVSRWRDEGGHSTTVVSNGGGRWVAVGGQSGIVNLYDRRWSFGAVVGSPGTCENPKPVKVLEQLVTAISVLEFSPDCQVLAVASKGKRDALKMVHLPSCTVYQNWPTSGTPLGRVTAVAWAGKETGIVAIGNEAGKVRLFEIQA